MSFASYLFITGNSIDDGFALFLKTVIVGEPVAGIRANVSLSAPAMAMRTRWPFLISTEVGCRPEKRSTRGRLMCSVIR